MSSHANELYVHTPIFTAAGRPWAEAMVVSDGRIRYVGDEPTARRIAGDDAVEVDAGGGVILPGFVDGHAHVVSTGELEGHADLWSAHDLAEIQSRVKTWATDHPDAARVRAQGWQHAALHGVEPSRELLDAVVADRPVYVQAFDLHSIWVNSAALTELGIDDGTPDPVGGKIARDPATGVATGLIDETAMQEYVWPFLEARQSDADRDRDLDTALDGYRRHGVTAAVDMALGEQDLAAFARREEAGTLTARLVGHWLVHRAEDPEENLAQVRRAAELARRHTSPWLRVTGIKIIVDGTVDGCTATLGRPYSNGELPGPIWDLDALAPVVAAADAAGLQVAMHAIGDEAIRIAIAAVENAVRVNPPRLRRHRIEHLEVVEEAEIARLAALGLTASMQPVHADPAIQENWRTMLGDERIERGFPWPEMTAAGAPLVFGTDSPTSPYAPLPNMFVAATRRSALNPTLPANVAHYALPLAEAVTHATRDAAWACRADESYGQLAPGLLADFVVVDRDIFTVAVDELLEARIVRTVVGGRTVWTA